MKKDVMFAAILMCCTVIANAQTEKGKWIASGSTSLSYSYTDHKEYGYGGEFVRTSKSSTLSASPSVGYFVIDNLAVEIAGTYMLEKTGDRSPNHTYAILPGLSYFFPLKGLVKPVISASVGYAGAAEGNLYGGGGTAYGGSAGIAVFLKDNISLDIGAAYLRTNFKYGGERVASGTVAAAFGFSFYL